MLRQPMTEVLRRYSTLDRLIVITVAVVVAEVIWLLLNALHSSQFVARVGSVVLLAAIVLAASLIHQRLTKGQARTSGPWWLLVVAIASGVGAAALLFDVRLTLGWVELIVLGYYYLLSLILWKTPLGAWSRGANHRE
jgi:hypothetical protein